MSEERENQDVTCERTPVAADLAITFALPLKDGSQKITIKAGHPIFVLGRNGTGKSALVNRVVESLGACAIYLPGARPSYFDDDEPSMTPISRRQFVHDLPHYNGANARWKNPVGSTRNEKALHDLLTAELNYMLGAATEVSDEGAASPAIARLQKKNSPLDLVNRVLAEAGFSVKIVAIGQTLKVQRGNVVYGYARMSDGERSALALAADVVSAEPGTVFVIDEPEKHLHPSIVVALVRTLVNQRPDCAFVIATHQLELPQDVDNSQLILVRSCQWVGQNADSWEVDIIEDPEKLPEDLWIDVVGSRKKVIFVEGNEKTSLDQPVYSLLFPDTSVRVKNTCGQVIRAVHGLRGTNKVHRVAAFGIIDNDGMSEERRVKFEKAGIFPLQAFSIESLVYARETIASVAQMMAATLRGETANRLVGTAEAKALALLRTDANKLKLAVKRATHRVRDDVISSIPKPKKIREIADGKVEIMIDSPLPGELRTLEQLLSESDLYAIIDRYPVREAGVLKEIAKALGFADKKTYEAAALGRIASIETLRTSLKSKLGQLEEALRKPYVVEDLGENEDQDAGDVDPH